MPSEEFDPCLTHVYNLPFWHSCSPSKISWAEFYTTLCYHSLSSLDVFRMFYEAEVDKCFVPCAQTLLWHGQNGCCLTDTPTMYYKRQDPYYHKSCGNIRIQWQKIIQIAERRGEKINEGTISNRKTRLWLEASKWSHLTRQILMKIKICSIRNEWTGAIWSD